jgi:hypothetical protein
MEITKTLNEIAFGATIEYAFNMRDIDDQPNSNSGDQGTISTHQNHVMSLSLIKENLVIRVGRDLLKSNRGSLRIIYEC